MASLKSHKDHFNYNLPKIKLQTIGIAGKVSALLVGKNWSPKGLVSYLFIVLYGVLPGMIVLSPICTGHLQPHVLQHCFSVVRVFMDTFQSLLHDITAKLFLCADNYRLSTLPYGSLLFPVCFPLCFLWLFLVTEYLLSLSVLAIGCSAYTPSGLWAPHLVPLMHPLPPPRVKMKLGLVLLSSVSGKVFPECF